MLNRLRKRLSARGFTLIELIVVMAVIAILVLLAAPRFLGYTQEAKITQAQHNAKVVENSMDEYLIKHDTLDASLVPVSNEDLNSIAQTGSLVDRNGVLTEVPEGTVFYKVPNDYVNGDLNIKQPAKDDVYITEDSYVVIDIKKSGAGPVPTAGDVSITELGLPRQIDFDNGDYTDITDRLTESDTTITLSFSEYSGWENRFIREKQVVRVFMMLSSPIPYDLMSIDVMEGTATDDLYLFAPGGDLDGELIDSMTVIVMEPNTTVRVQYGDKTLTIIITD